MIFFLQISCFWLRRYKHHTLGSLLQKTAVHFSNFSSGKYFHRQSTYCSDFGCPCRYSKVNYTLILQFLPQTGDSKIVTGAADNQVLAFDAVTKETYYICNCAKMRIKRIATSPDSSDVFWSASEDGFIRFNRWDELCVGVFWKIADICHFCRQTDLRLPHTCDTEAKNVIISLKNHQGALAEGKCIAINPLRTEMLAVGANDPYVRLYDRRMIKLATDYVIILQ